MTTNVQKRSFTLRQRLILGFGTVIALLGLALYASHSQIGSAKRNLDALVGGVTLGQLAAQAEVDFLHANAAAQTFLRLRDRTDVETANARLDAVEQKFARMRDLDASAANADAAGRSERADQLVQSRSLLAEYRSLLNDILALHEKKGLTEKEGLQGRFREAVHAVEKSIKEVGLPELSVLMLMARRHEKDYMLRGDKKYIGRIDERMAEFDEQVTLFGLPETTHAELTALWSTYRQGVAKLVETDDALAEKIDRFHATVGKMLTTLTGVVEATEQAVAREEQAAAGNLDDTTQILLWMFAGAALLALLVSFAVIRSITHPVAVLIRSARRIGEGDLTADEELAAVATERHELGRLAEAFVAMTHMLGEMVENMQTGARNLTSSTNQILGTSQAAASTASEQAATVTQVTTTAEEIRQTGVAVAKSASDVLDSSEKALQAGRTGGERVGDAERAMDSIGERVKEIAAKMLHLSEQSSQVGQIVAQVNALTEQSTLLAVNASIEAAKAGEQGRGFSVVAEEVRKLAEQSRHSTERIRDILDEIQKATHSAMMATEEGTKQVDAGRDTMSEVSEVIAELGQVLEENADHARQIAGATQQQVAGVEEITKAMEAVAEASQQASVGAKELQLAVTDLNSLAGRIDETVVRYVM